MGSIKRYVFKFKQWNKYEMFPFWTETHLRSKLAPWQMIGIDFF